MNCLDYCLQYNATGTKHSNVKKNMTHYAVVVETNTSSGTIYLNSLMRTDMAFTG